VATKLAQASASQAPDHCLEGWICPTEGTRLARTSVSPVPYRCLEICRRAGGVIVLVESPVVKDTGIEAKMGHQSGAVFMAGRSPGTHLVAGCCDVRCVHAVIHGVSGGSNPCNPILGGKYEKVLQNIIN
jgi:hypothetical protein